MCHMFLAWAMTNTPHLEHVTSSIFSRGQMQHPMAGDYDFSLAKS